MLKTDKLKLGIVTTPIGKSGLIPLSNLIDIVRPISDNIFIITGNEFTKQNILNDQLNVISLYYNYELTGLDKVINFIFLQLKILYNLLGELKTVKFLLFFNASVLVLPILASKILNKKVILLLAGSASQSSKYMGSSFSKPLYIIERINLVLSDHIILYSQNLVKEWNLGNYRHKISIAPRHFLNFKQFNVQRPIDERDNLVGYIGRMTEEKGILNFVKAISKIVDGRYEVKFLVGGDGHLRDKIKKNLDKEISNGEVKFSDWIPHDELQNHLNGLKLLILPSNTEGLPNIMLEAMACGTPVLATSVGAIPDIIIEGRTGFLLKSNDPNHIAERIVEILDKPEILEKVSITAYRYVKENFNYEKTLEAWRKIFSELVGARIQSGIKLT